MDYSALPPELASAVSSENKDFMVMSERAEPKKKSFLIIKTGVFLTVIVGIMTLSFFGPLFLGKEVHFTLNGVPTVASPDNLGPIMMPALIIGVFVLVTIGVFARGVHSLLKKGGYFVGTPTRLVRFQDGTLRSIDWEQFSGDIEVSGTVEKGDITLQLRTGKMVNKKRGPDKYVPETVYISGIPNVFEVERLCRKRIKENDPTPAENTRSAI